MAETQYNLALLHLQGLGTTADNVKAATWLLLADAAGNPRAENYLRSLSGSMNPNTIQQAYAINETLGRDIAQLRK